MLNVNIRNYFLQELSKITYGSIKIFTPEGELITYISKGADKNSSTELTELVLYNWSVIKNLFFKGINAIIQDYSIGKFKTNNLYNLLSFLLLNKFIKYTPVHKIYNFLFIKNMSNNMNNYLSNLTNFSNGYIDYTNLINGLIDDSHNSNALIDILEFSCNSNNFLKVFLNSIIVPAKIKSNSYKITAVTTASNLENMHSVLAKFNNSYEYQQGQYSQNKHHNVRHNIASNIFVYNNKTYQDLIKANIKYDYIVLADIFNMQALRQKFFNYIAKLLKSNGKFLLRTLVINDNNKYQNSAAINLNVNMRFFELNLLSQSRLERYLQKSNLVCIASRVIDVDYVKFFEHYLNTNCLILNSMLNYRINIDNKIVYFYISLYYLALINKTISCIEYEIIINED